MAEVEAGELQLEEKVIHINRVAKVVKGGRRFNLSAIVVVGDKQSRVGIGYGKGREVPLAIRKGVQEAKKNLFEVSLQGSTLPHEIIGRYGAAAVLLKPASKGTGVIAGGPVRAILEMAGVKDVLTKSLGSPNPLNVARATVAGLKALKTLEEVARARGKKTEELLGRGGQRS